VGMNPMKTKKMKKILSISMMLVFGFSFSQEKKSETPKEPVKIERTTISKSSDVRIYLNMKRKLTNLELLFPTPKRDKIKEC
jgi:hypothetical protein